MLLLDVRESLRCERSHSLEKVTLKNFFPFLVWWPARDSATWRADAIAGLIGAVVVLPQSIAFATLAGLPPQYGLYAAMVPVTVAALFGSSLHAVSGPTNAVSLYVFATLSPLALPGSPDYISLSLALAFMSGVMMLVVGLFRFGRIVNLVSNSVVVGFTAGAGALIFASQLPVFFGVVVPAGTSFLGGLRTFAAEIPHTSIPALLVGATTLAAALLARRFLPRIPYMITAMIGGGLVAFLLNLLLGPERAGIPTLGKLPGALPSLSRPDLTPDTVKTLMGIAVGATILSLTQTMSITRSLALKSGQRIDANQECLGQGLANIAAGFFSGYLGSASFNRSGLNYEAGARTPLAAVFSAVVLLALVWGVGPLIAFLPLASMAAILFMVAFGLIDFDAIRKILRASRADGFVMVATFASTLVMNLESAILVGVTFSLVAYLNRTSRPQMTSVVPDPLHAMRRFAPAAKGLEECPQFKILSVEGSIYFGAVDHVESHFDTLRARESGKVHLLIVARNINFVDMEGAETLAREAVRRRAIGGRLYLYGMRRQVEETLRAAGLMHEIGEECVFREKREAIAAVFARLDPDVCARCKVRIFNECASRPLRDDDEGA